MTNPSFRENGLGFVAVTVRFRQFLHVFRAKSFYEIQTEFHGSLNSPRET